jgi:hypothetical protein
VGKERPLVHLTRVKLALMPLRLQIWPHEGPMLLREGDGERTQYHVIDGWQHLGSFDAGDEDAVAFYTGRSRRVSERFDIDAYRIFTRYLRDSRHVPQPLPQPHS